MYRPNPRLGAFTFGSSGTGFGNLIEDPVVPAVSGAQFIKVVAALAAVAWVFKRFK
jgi:hypothetical protein